ncbi:MAG: serine/threonine-protein kinase [Deltaproteobacteria bacterium]
MRPETRRSLAPGTRFGRYEVLADIASGGMAMVYLGRALGAAGFQRLVAIKVMHAQYAHDEDFVAMFMDEARLAAQIRHPNVVATLDLENDADGLYLVMEYIEGDTLVGLLKAITRAGQRIPQPVVMRVVIDSLSGLHAAHDLLDEQGNPVNLVHRDVSPHNILVGLDGISRITDFGIARAEARLGTTREGQVKGKLAYMAPEQTLSESVDRRADLFATGIVLWECLAGRRLFAGQSDGEVYRKLIELPVPRLRDVLPEASPALDEVCARALARDQNERFSTAAEFAEALESAVADLGAGAVASSRVVGQFVREMSGAKIGAVAERARESRVSSPSNPDATGSSSAVRALRRAEGTDPSAAAGLAAHTSLPPEGIAPAPARSEHTASVVRTGIVPEAPRTLRRAVWLAAVLVLLLGGGAAAAFAVRGSGRHDPAATAIPTVSPPAVPSPPHVAAAPGPASEPAVVPVVANAAPVASAVDAGLPGATSTGERDGDRHHRPRTATTAASGSTTAASPAGSPVAAPATPPATPQAAVAPPAPHVPYNPEAL